MITLTFEQSRHLVERTGFGADLHMIMQFSKLSKEQAIRRVITKSTDYHIPQPKLHSFTKLKKTRKKNKQKANRLVRQDRNNVKYWALKYLLTNPNPLQEKMTWFWHNHFTSSDRKSLLTLTMLTEQSLLIRSHALTNFADLLKAIPYDRLMLIYLDGARNKKGNANENFSRELLELFTLGEGHYSDQDVKEVARSFTGWSFNKKRQVVRKKRRYDDGIKTVFGRTGAFDSDDILDMLLANSRTAEFIAEKFWYEFISIDKPPQNVIKSWAKNFQSNQYDIKALLNDVLSSNEFWDPKYRGSLIKSPLDLVIGTLKTLDLEDKNLPLPSIANSLRRMGQDLFRPPNVKGWPGGAAWVDDVTLPLRQQFLTRLMRGNKKKQRGKMQTGMMASMSKQARAAMPSADIPELPPSQWETWLLPISAVTDIPTKNKRRQLIAILLDPAYQLK